MRAPLFLLRLGGRWNIFDQLVLEEAMLRSDARNWCVLNRGASPPTVVMGSSGNAAKLVDVAAVKADNIPVVRRFSGGGTVVTDHNTLFVSLICNKEDVTGTPLYPRELMKWSVERMYAPIFNILAPSHNFTLSEHDYCFNELKFAGNAQCISRERWVHHTSFLWDYDTFNMKYLLMPEKRPAYRRDREHHQFLTRLKQYLPVSAEPETFYEEVVHQLREMFDVKEVSTEEAAEILTRPQERKANSYELL